MKEISLSAAAILLYTAPAFVIVLSKIFFQENITVKKLISLCFTFVGCIFVTGYFQHTESQVSLYGIIIGIGSGFGYALYSIFGKAALKKYDTLTVTVYSFIFASIGLLPFSDFDSIIGMFGHIQDWGNAAALGLFPTVFAFIFYTKGLEHLESGIASILATIEPIVATMIGVFIFKEQLTFSHIVGIFLVITAVVIVSERRE
jgi:drug/metabolite transporter (DMT)-like permease